VKGIIEQDFGIPALRTGLISIAADSIAHFVLTVTLRRKVAMPVKEASGETRKRTISALAR
jgi:hypothetical protein